MERDNERCLRAIYGTITVVTKNILLTLNVLIVIRSGPQKNLKLKIVSTFKSLVQSTGRKPEAEYHFSFCEFVINSLLLKSVSNKI